MSAPRTNIETQAKRHWGPLLGMAIVVIFAVGAIFIWLTKEVSDGDSPDGQDGIAESVPATETVPPLPSQTAPAPQGSTP